MAKSLLLIMAAFDYEIAFHIQDELRLRYAMILFIDNYVPKSPMLSLITQKIPKIHSA